MSERCQALDINGRQCRQTARRTCQYHGASDLYGVFYEPWPGWVKVWLCEEHRRDQKPRRERTR